MSTKRQTLLRAGRHRNLRAAQAAMRAARDRVAYTLPMNAKTDASELARAALLHALADGRAYTPRELTKAARLSAVDARHYLQGLEQDRVVTVRRQGPHSYFQLSGDSDAAKRQSAPAHIMTGPKDPAMRAARVCYGHLAGPRAVRLYDGLVKHSLIHEDRDAVHVTDAGRDFFGDFGIDRTVLNDGQRPPCKTCLDWTERRSHLGGPLAAAVFDRMTELGWVTRDPSSRRVTFGATGEIEFDAQFGG